MQKPLIATTLIVAGTFGSGCALTQVASATPTFAAGVTHKHAATKKTVTTTKPAAKEPATKKPVGTTSTAQHADGQITAVSGDTITVKTDADKAGSNEYTAVTTVQLTATTQYNAGKGAAPTTTKPAIAAGAYIVAEGTLSSDDSTLTATQVSVGVAGAAGH